MTGQITGREEFIIASFVISALVTGIVGPSLGWADWVSASLVAVILPVQNFLLFRLWVYTGTAA